ncbi:MAG: PQQ-dependent sugar dehydrogenase, partial [Acidimicrobiia bacterium]
MRSRLATVVAVATLVAFAACQPKSPPPAPPAPPGSPTPPGVPTLTKQVLMSNLSQPWDLAFTPNDGTMLFTEKSGAISAYLGGVKRQLGTVSDVRVMSEGGLLGMAI